MGSCGSWMSYPLCEGQMSRLNLAISDQRQRPYLLRARYHLSALVEEAELHRMKVEGAGEVALLPMVVGFFLPMMLEILTTADPIGPLAERPGGRYRLVDSKLHQKDSVASRRS